ncbi:hypothetical protein E3Q22_01209 [Wallemia mellicola]|uniref:Uncharacterized protein n=1 Tax=Wallemia mellicola TaxID=1708541 RepID=A0A4T0P9T9_9BASI|nr:hypothetical protein E3Q22_01209 [Wallemia mellicola]TIC06904.1 hypothetical protein E3Q16_00773 [Wallemia mellicola]
MFAEEGVTKLHMQVKPNGWELYEGSSTRNSDRPVYTAQRDDDGVVFLNNNMETIGRSNIPKATAWRDKNINLTLNDRSYELCKPSWWRTCRFLQIVNTDNNHVLATFTYSQWSKRKLGVIRHYSTENPSDNDRQLFTIILSIVAKVDSQRQL